MKVVKGSDAEDAPDPWRQDVAGKQPDTITRAVNATADEIKRLYDSYPAELSDDGMGLCGYVAIVGGPVAAAVLVFLAGWFW